MLTKAIIRLVTYPLSHAHYPMLPTYPKNLRIKPTSQRDLALQKKHAPTDSFLPSFFTYWLFSPKRPPSVMPLWTPFVRKNPSIMEVHFLNLIILPHTSLMYKNPIHWTLSHDDMFSPASTWTYYRKQKDTDVLKRCMTRNYMKFLPTETHFTTKLRNKKTLYKLFRTKK